MIPSSPAGITVAEDREALGAGLDRLRRDHASICLVPTMGALHEGHLSLLRAAQETGGAVVVSIFVNPLQFGQGEDYHLYPRDLSADLTRAEDHGVDLVFAPSTDEVYGGSDPVVTVDPGEAGGRLCGAHRPGHFRGVLTVVTKLFGLVRPDTAIFGRKDFQQSVLIRRMVKDLDLGVEICVAPTVREADGLALSSRNAYLSAEERADAVRLSAGLFAADHLFRAGETNAAALLEEARARIAAGRMDLQYLEIVDPSTLEPVEEASHGTVIALAAFCGDTRLIDNVVLGGPSDPRLAS